MAVSKMGPVREAGIALPDEARRRLVEELVQASLELRDLALACKVAHWNVRGIGFSGLHPFFDDLVDHLDGSVDLAAERAVALGGYARGTSRDVAAATPLAPYPEEARLGESHVRALAERFRILAQHLRRHLAAAETIGDPDTVDLFTEVSRQFEKDLWMVEAHLDT